jgi:hypothetical protein
MRRSILGRPRKLPSRHAGLRQWLGRGHRGWTVWENVANADTIGGCLVLRPDEAGSHQHGEPWTHREKLFGEVEAGHARHGQVCDHGRKVIRAGAEVVQGNSGIGVTCNVVAKPVKEQGAEGPDLPRCRRRGFARSVLRERSGPARPPRWWFWRYFRQRGSRARRVCPCLLRCRRLWRRRSC